MTTPELKESDDFLDPALMIPVKGKVYRIEPMSAESVLIMQKAQAAVEKAKDEGKTLAELKEMEVEGLDAEETREQTERRIFGPAYDELVADSINHVIRFRMTQIIMAWTFYGLDAAKAYVNTQGKAITMPNRAERRTATRTRTAAASTTRKPSSRSTTSTPKAMAAKAVGGKTSSSTGAPSKPTSKTTTA